MHILFSYLVVILCGPIISLCIFFYIGIPLLGHPSFVVIFIIRLVLILFTFAYFDVMWYMHIFVHIFHFFCLCCGHCDRIVVSNTLFFTLVSFCLSINLSLCLSFFSPPTYAGHSLISDHSLILWYFFCLDFSLSMLKYTSCNFPWMYCVMSISRIGHILDILLVCTFNLT